MGNGEDDDDNGLDLGIVRVVGGEFVMVMVWWNEMKEEETGDR